jgi:hypothetical protein
MRGEYESSINVDNYLKLKTNFILTSLFYVKFIYQINRIVNPILNLFNDIEAYL